MDFSVYYGWTPFTIEEHYFPVSPPERGHFTKKVIPPGSHSPSNLITLDTVIVDIVGSTKAYEAFSLYACTSKLGVRVQEIQIVSRATTISPAVLDELKAGLHRRGIEFEDSQLKLVSRDRCPNSLP